MSSAPVISRYSRQEYLDRERASNLRHEYHAGEIFAMSGGSANHSLICANLAGILGDQLRGGPCRRYESNLKVWIEEFHRYVYPDATIVCGQSLFEDHKCDVLLNPQVICEVLSESTEKHDRGNKFRWYRSLPTFREYLLISQEAPLVERFFRHDNDDWLIADYRGLDAFVELGAVPGCRLSLAELYEGVEFPIPPPSSEPRPLTE
jgi:Uma2 family endonuclease